MYELKENQLIPRPFETTRMARTQDSSPLDIPYWEEEPGLNLSNYWHIIKRRRWIILALLIFTIAIAAAYSFKARPIYQAKGRVQIDKESPNVVAYKDFVTESSDNEQVAVATQAEVLGSQTLASRVIHQLDLQHHPLFDPAPSSPLLQDPSPTAIDDTKPGVGKENEDDAIKNEVIIVDQFLKQLEVTPVRGSRIIEVAFSSSDPQLAARITNAIINSYIELNMESRYQATQKASEWLMKQSLDLKSKVEKSEEDLISYARANQIVSTDEKQDIVTQKLTDLNEELTKAQADRIAKESLFRQIHSGAGVDFNLIRENSLIKTLSERQAALAQQYAELTARFGPDWPTVKQAKSQMDEVKKQLVTETERILKSFDVDYFTAVKREQLLQRALDEQKAQASQLREKYIEYNILKREVDSNKQVYDGLSQRLKEAGVSAGLKSSNIRIVDTARVPKDPIRPKKAKNIVIGLLLGLGLGLGAAFLLEFIDTSLKTPDEVVHILGLRSLAMVPALTNGRRHKSLAGSNGRLLTAPPTIDLVAQTNLESVISEAYRSLRTSILFSTNGHPPKSILVTSPGPREGKTATAANLAVTLTQLRRRVLIIDADMRRPRLHKIFEIPTDVSGLSELLCGASKLEPLILKTKIPNLFLIPAGTTPSDPSELLSSELMRRSLELLGEHFDHIIVDSPPVLSVTDATVLSTLVEGVILVVQGGFTESGPAAVATQRLRDVGARIIGTVINKVDLKSGGYDAYYHQYYYHYYPSERGTDQRNSPRQG